MNDSAVCRDARVSGASSSSSGARERVLRLRTGQRGEGNARTGRRAGRAAWGETGARQKRDGSPPTDR